MADHKEFDAFVVAQSPWTSASVVGNWSASYSRSAFRIALGEPEVLQGSGRDPSESRAARGYERLGAGSFVSGIAGQCPVAFSRSMPLVVRARRDPVDING